LHKNEGDASRGLLRLVPHSWSGASRRSIVKAREVIQACTRAELMKVDFAAREFCELDMP